VVSLSSIMGCYVKRFNIGGEGSGVPFGRPERSDVIPDDF
jgi:hypothetical protein